MNTEIIIHPTPNVMVRRDGASDGRMDRPTTYRGLRLGAGGAVGRSRMPMARSRCLNISP
jgi:hypothetical protein